MGTPQALSWNLKGFSLGVREETGRPKQRLVKNFKLAQVLRVEITYPSATSRRTEVISKEEKNTIQSPHLLKLKTKCTKKQDQEKKKRQ